MDKNEYKLKLATGIERMWKPEQMAQELTLPQIEAIFQIVAYGAPVEYQRATLTDNIFGSHSYYCWLVKDIF